MVACVCKLSAHVGGWQAIEAGRAAAGVTRGELAVAGWPWLTDGQARRRQLLIMIIAHLRRRHLEMENWPMVAWKAGLSGKGVKYITLARLFAVGMPWHWRLFRAVANGRRARNENEIAPGCRHHRKSRGARAGEHASARREITAGSFGDRILAGRGARRPTCSKACGRGAKRRAQPGEAGMA